MQPKTFRFSKVLKRNLWHLTDPSYEDIPSRISNSISLQLLRNNYSSTRLFHGRKKFKCLETKT